MNHLGIWYSLYRFNSISSDLGFLVGLQSWHNWMGGLLHALRYSSPKWCKCEEPYVVVGGYVNDQLVMGDAEKATRRFSLTQWAALAC